MESDSTRIVATELGVFLVVALFQSQVENGGPFGHELHRHGDFVLGVAGVNFGAVPLVLIAGGPGENAHETVLDGVPEGEERLHQFHGPEGVAHVLHRFQAFNVVEEPAAAGKAEQAEFLDFQKTHGLGAFFGVFGMVQYGLQEAGEACFVFRSH